MPTPGRFQIDPDDSRPLYIQIMDEVKRAISLGELATDDPVPSVRDLAGELRVNPNTVQQAYRELEHEGVVEVRRGRGTFVSPDLDRSRVEGEVLRDLTDEVLRLAARAGVPPDALADSILQRHQQRHRPPTPKETP